ncbi:MAG TPA: nitroreductase family protein [Thermomicrobiales bacterium]|nr:nitroreductase family protein [Thermomicrobiales bacterium]
MPAGVDYLDFLKGQRQTREFTLEAVSDADIQALLETMRWTGSSSNSQPWQFVVVRDQAAKDALAQATQYTGWIANAPLILAVLTAGPDPTAHAYDLGRVDERILLAAQALGLGAGIVTFWSDAAQALARKTLQLPDDWSIYSAVAVGHPAESARAAKLGGRKPLDELVNWETYGNR